jgi:hypothetical protein
MDLESLPSSSLYFEISPSSKTAQPPFLLDPGRTPADSHFEVLSKHK